MFQLLSELISTIFYNIPFLWKKDNQLNDSDLPSLFQKHGRLIFIDTPHSSKEKKWKETLNQRHSRQNMEEAKAVIRALKNFDAARNIVILTPYNGQVDLIRNLLPSKYEHIEVFTTDGFQGKEADFILLSLVRNNLLSGRRRWGFVTDPHRLNVALSRAREGLVLISSRQQIEESEMEDGYDHLLQTLEFIKKHGKVIPIQLLGRSSK
jgi:superfamily I DNA and/or RNA helicase